MAYEDAPDGSADPKVAAEERAKDSIRMANGPADDLVAGTMASADPPMWTIVAFTSAAPFTLSLVPALTSGSARWIATTAAIVVYGFGSAIIAELVFPRLRRPVYLAVTHDELIGYRVPKMSRRPAGADLRFRAPLSAVRIKGRKGKKNPYWVTRVASRGPGATGRLPPLRIDQSWSGELCEVAIALQASGAQVQPALLDITAA